MGDSSPFLRVAVGGALGALVGGDSITGRMLFAGLGAGIASTAFGEKLGRAAGRAGEKVSARLESRLGSMPSTKACERARRAYERRPTPANGRRLRKCR